MRIPALGLSLVAAVNLVFAARCPISADVIPSRPSKERTDQKKKVAAQLSLRGVSAPDSSGYVREMSASDLGYFTGDERRVQLAAGLTWEEWVFGGAMLLLIGGVIAFFVIRAKNK